MFVPDIGRLVGIGMQVKEISLVFGGPDAVLAFPEDDLPFASSCGERADAGMVDDRFGISPRVKLLVQGSLTICFLATLIPFTFSRELWLWPIGLLWMVGLTNAFNLLDNLDGILGGVGAMVGLIVSALILPIFKLSQTAH